MDDSKIVNLYWARSEDAIAETAAKYGSYCRTIALHILTDDIEYAVNLGIEECGCGIMRNRFDFAVVEKKCGFKECFTVSCGASACDPCAFGKFFFYLGNGSDGCL